VTQLALAQVRPAATVIPFPTRPRRLVHDSAHVASAAGALASGAVVGTAFANLYALVTRPDAETVRDVNLMKGRPPAQVGSITVPPSAIPDLWDFSLLPPGLTRRSVLEVVDAFFRLGPFGFRGPAAAHVPEHLSSVDAGVRTAQVITPGYACPSNLLLGRALQSTGADFLYVTSANRSRHATGADDSPAHWRVDGLAAEFGDRPNFLMLEHRDEAAARLRYPRHLPMSTSVLSFHTVGFEPGDRRPHLTLERHGSLAVTEVRAVLAELGFGLTIGPRANRRLALRDYAVRW
jgi:hypothetical protein